MVHAPRYHKNGRNRTQSVQLHVQCMLGLHLQLLCCFHGEPSEVLYPLVYLGQVALVIVVRAQPTTRWVESVIKCSSNVNNIIMSYTIYVRFC